MPATTVEVVSPFAFRCNPHVAQARQHVVDWVGRTGLIRRESARRRFDRADFGWFASLVYPTADRVRLELLADWFAWLFLVDDELDDGRIGRDGTAALAALDDLLAVLGEDRVAPSAAESVAVTALADLWRRTSPGTGPTWRRRFTGHLAECLRTAVTWEASNRIHGIVPDVATYVDKRRHTGAIYVCMDLIEIAEGIEIADSRHGSPEFTAALDAACDVVCWTNDVYSLAKERALGEIHNLVYLVATHDGMSLAEATRTVSTRINAETARYLDHEAALLGGAPTDHPDLARYAAGMRSWMRGNLDWSSRTKRYQDPVDVGAPAEYLEATLVRESP
ncbi:MAG TPA: hypothetical protein VHF06_14190 [Pseudonocardiaceae bacterium]|jgi:hypothetical protein|nr:hypothetical protein [Pseudonocardiaceae bacterium]